MGNFIRATLSARLAPVRLTSRQVAAYARENAATAAWTVVSISSSHGMSGWLSRLLSTRVLFVASAAGFTLFSLACISAGNLDEMIIFRAAQGFIGGTMIPAVFATSYLLFQGARRAQVPVLIGLTATLAPTMRRSTP